ncbi:MAG: ribosome recycling factor [Lachnospiraceae bacterium]|nr:ribosome recycling factor [Lachnospiraceae bacterium]
MEEIIMTYEEKMQKSYENLLGEYTTIRAGRANPHILDRIQVDYYGSPTPIQQVGNISVPEARMIVIQPWDASVLKDLEKALLMSDLGLTPTNDGKCIRLVFPELTEERRKELVKDVKKKGEAAKVAVRNIRRDAIDAIKKKGKEDGISEDEVKSYEDDVQKLTDKFVEKIDGAVEDKSKEILTV